MTKSNVSKKKLTSNENASKVEFRTINTNILKKLLPVILILVVMSVGFFVRSGPVSLDGLEERVEASVHLQIQNIISSQIEANYPNLNDINRQELVNKELQKVIETGDLSIIGESANLNEIVRTQSENIKELFKADNGQTYLNAIDPYFFLGLSENYLENGHTGTSLKNINGKEVPWVDLRLAPVGGSGTYEPEFHIWLESNLFKLSGVDENSDIGEKTRVIFLLSVILAILCSIPVFLIIRQYSNDLIAFLGSLLLVSIGTFVSRTIAGFVDTDAYNILFPLIIVTFLVYALAIKDFRWRIFLGCLAGLSQAIFLWAWGSGWFIFLFTSISLIGYLIYLVILGFLDAKESPKAKDTMHFKSIITRENPINNVVITLIGFLISSAIFNYLINSANIFKLTFNGLFGSLSGLASISQSNIWPNVFSSVAELNPASFDSIISSVGGKIVFLIAMMGLVMLSIDFKSKTSKHIIARRILLLFSVIWFSFIIWGNFLESFIANTPYIFLILLMLPVGVGLLLSLLNSNNSNKIFLTMLLSIWVAGTIFMSLNGVRFILLLAPTFAISFAMGLYYIATYINKFIAGETSIKGNLGKIIPGYVIILVIFLVIFVPIFQNANAISKGTTPNFDDAWYGAMYKVRDNSSEDAIITSWWDFGHFFVAIGERGVTFDGASQTTPRSHWVGKLLLESDEQKSHDILRMLVCGGNEAHNIMLNITNGDNSDAVKINKIIYSTLGENISNTRVIIENNEYYDFTQSQIDEIMNLLACDVPSQNFLITSGDMVGKAGVWAHWGSWDFTKKYVHDNYKLKSAQEIANLIDEDLTLIDKHINELKDIDIRATTENIKREDLTNQWFAPYPSYIPLSGRYTYPCSFDNGSLVCQNGIEIDSITGNITSQFNEQVKFKNLIFPQADGNLRIVEQDSDGDIDIVLVPSYNGFEALLAQNPLGSSLFTKLYYLDGYGTNLFEKFDDKQSATGVRIKTWETLWNKTETEENLNEIDLDNIEFEVNTENLTKNTDEELMKEYNESLNSSN